MRFSYQINEREIQHLLQRIWLTESGAFDHVKQADVIRNVEAKGFHTFKPYINCTVMIGRNDNGRDGQRFFASVLWRSLMQ